jgi:dimethylsulfoniopropionate demethylase
VADKILSVSRRTRATVYTQRVEAAGVKTYTIYNHMLLATEFESFEADYWHLCEHVQVWDVAAERQVEITGPDSARLIQLMTPRDISRAVNGQCLYAPLCDVDGGIINDPIAIKHSDEHWWLSIADSDVKLWAKGLATGFGLDVKITEPDVSPLAIQGPKAEDLTARVFGESIRDIRFFRGRMLNYRGTEMYVARSGWCKQGGFEIYLNNPDLAHALWDELFEKGEDLNVRAGCPNLIERLESGLLSLGNDIDSSTNPFECGLDQYIKLDANIESLSLPALREIAGKHKQQLVGLLFTQPMNLVDRLIRHNGQTVGEITSAVWSPRYSKHLAFAVMKRDYLEGQSSVEVDGIVGTIEDLPFSLQALLHKD